MINNAKFLILFLITFNLGFSQNEKSNTAILIEYKRSNFGENWWERSGSYDYKIVENNLLAKAYLKIKPSSSYNLVELESGYKSEIITKKDSAWVWLPVGSSEIIKFKSTKNGSKVRSNFLLL